MRKTPALILGTVIVSIALCALTGAQSSPKRRTPALTTDDLGSAREVVRMPAVIETQPSTSGDREVIHRPIAWRFDLRRAFQIASADDQLIVADVYTDWCGWCKMMDKTIYSNPAIVALSRQYVFVKVNAEDRGDGQRFAREMGVKAYPTTIILDGQGRVLNIAEGYIASPQAFGAFVQAAQARVR